MRVLDRGVSYVATFILFVALGAACSSGKGSTDAGIDSTGASGQAGGGAGAGGAAGATGGQGGSAGAGGAAGAAGAPACSMQGEACGSTQPCCLPYVCAGGCVMRP
jgi:hypothetical protein